MLAGMLNINSDQSAKLIEIQNDTVSHLIAILAGFVDQMDIQRIGIWIVGKSHGLNLLSGKALCSVTPSSNVTTRKYLFNSVMNIQ